MSKENWSHFPTPQTTNVPFTCEQSPRARATLNMERRAAWSKLWMRLRAQRVQKIEVRAVPPQVMRVTLWVLWNSFDGAQIFWRLAFSSRFLGNKGTIQMKSDSDALCLCTFQCFYYIFFMSKQIWTGCQFEAEVLTGCWQRHVQRWSLHWFFKFIIPEAGV